MKGFSSISFCLLVLLLSANAFSQIITPHIQDDKDIVKISTNLIQIDATVTDKKGNIVKNLKPEDFKIYENGKEQVITNFSFIGKSADDKATQVVNPSQAKNKSFIPLPPVKIKPEQVRRTYALVVDDLGLSYADTDYVKDCLKKFVNEQMQDGDLVAIVRVGSGLGALQSFTSDKRILLAAISKIRWNINGRVGISSFEPISESLLESLGLEGHPDRAAMDANDKALALKTEMNRQSNVASGTFGALSYIVKAMSELPGRKSLMLFSEGFQTLDYSRKSTFNSQSSVPETTQVFQLMKSLTELANRSSIVIYTFDPRGITLSGLDASDDVGTPSAGESKTEDFREKQVRNSKDSLRYLSEETGGLAYVDLNRMDLGIQKALNDQNGFYLVGYQPDEETFDAKKSKFNRLEVKLNNPDLKVRYRSGFFAFTNEEAKQSQTIPQQFNDALASPFGASDINLDLYSVGVNTLQNKNFIHSFLKIDANNLKFVQTSDGKYKSTVQIYAITFGDNGVPVDRTVGTYNIRLDEENYRQILQNGLIYDFPLAIKKPGAYQFRIALLDMGTRKIGSASQFIELPDVSKKNLTISNIVLEGYTKDDWKKMRGEIPNDENEPIPVSADFISRRFKRGVVMNYSYIIYNAKNAVPQNSHLKIGARLFYNGKLISEGLSRPIDVAGQKDLQRIELSNVVNIGANMQTGDYILQLIVTNDSDDGKSRIATQSIDFEIVE